MIQPQGSAARAQDLPRGWAQLVVCLEVFEHLPAADTHEALSQIDRVLGPGGAPIVGVPVEIRPIALAKGVFRSLRRPDAPDARWRDIMAAALCRPVLDRALIPLDDGLSYYGGHLGFDHRILACRIQTCFQIERRLDAFGLNPLP